jgi:predicted transcriptional regulator of viral defense system
MSGYRMRKNFDWVSTLAAEAKTNPLVRIGETASKYGLGTAAVTKALHRLKARGLVERVADGLYLNKLVASVSARDIVNELNPESYISLGTALAEWGLSSQNPVATTCVTTSRGRKIKAGAIEIVYRKISQELFWGYTEKKGRYRDYKIAEPEKALLDWIYFSLKGGLPVQFDEIQFEKLSRSRLVDYAKKYPSTVVQTLFFPLLEGQITGLRP